MEVIQQEEMRKDAQDLVTGGVWGVRGDAQVSQAVSTSCPPSGPPGLTWATGLADIADVPTVLHPVSPAHCGPRTW